MWLIFITGAFRALINTRHRSDVSKIGYWLHRCCRPLGLTDDYGQQGRLYRRMTASVAVCTVVRAVSHAVDCGGNVSIRCVLRHGGLVEFDIAWLYCLSFQSPGPAQPVVGVGEDGEDEHQEDGVGDVLAYQGWVAQRLGDETNHGAGHQCRIADGEYVWASPVSPQGPEGQQDAEESQYRDVDGDVQPCIRQQLIRYQKHPGQAADQPPRRSLRAAT